MADDSAVDDLYLGRNLQKLGERHLNIVNKSLRSPALRRGYRLLDRQPPRQRRQLGRKNSRTLARSTYLRSRHARKVTLSTAAVKHHNQKLRPQLSNRDQSSV